MAITWLLLVTLSQGYATAGAARASDFQFLSTLVQATGKWIGHVLSIVFSLGALMIYCLFYQSRLLPRWLSIWGLLGAVLYLAEPLLAIFGSELKFLLAPLAIQEMVIAAWLIFKCFNPAAAPFIVDKQFPSPAAVSARRASGLEKGEYGHDSAIHLPFFDEAKLLED